MGVRRRKFWATAGALSATAFAATVGLGANLGLFGITEPNSSVGHLGTDRSAASADVTVGPASVTAGSPPTTGGPRSAPPDD
jgi:hypothetical protein